MKPERRPNPAIHADAAAWTSYGWSKIEPGLGQAGAYGSGRDARGLLTDDGRIPSDFGAAGTCGQVARRRSQGTFCAQPDCVKRVSVREDSLQAMPTLRGEPGRGLTLETSAERTCRSKADCRVRPLMAGSVVTVQRPRTAVHGNAIATGCSSRSSTAHVDPLLTFETPSRSTAMHVAVDQVRSMTSRYWPHFSH